MTVITISREYGSGGNHIASLLCDQLGYRFFDKNLMAQIGAPQELRLALARAGSASEVRDEHSALWRFFRNLQASSPVGMQEGSEPNEVLPADVVERAIRLAYDDDNVVIIGRGGQMVLRGKPNAFHVRIVAPIERRVETVAKYDGLPLDAARNRVVAHDKTAAAYIRDTYRADLTDPKLYDLVINTERLTWECAATTIATALKCFAPQAK